MSFPCSRAAFCAIVSVLLTASAASAAVDDSAPTTLSVTQILAQIQHHNKSQAEELKQYQAVRHYQAEYQGFSTSIVGNMEVAVSFDAALGKSFRIVSQNGSKILCEKVLKRAVDSEREAQQDNAATALTPANYRFQLLGTEYLNGRPAYIMNVAPLKDSKFLYRGKIWVDAADFAVAKIEAEPAKSPSFWISRTLIHYTSAKTGDFWLPQRSRSETKVRIGGNATLTIDYGTYQTVSNSPPRSAGN